MQHPHLIIIHNYIILLLYQHTLVPLRGTTLVAVQDIQTFSTLIFVHIITLADYTIMILCFYPLSPVLEFVSSPWRLL